MRIHVLGLGSIGTLIAHHLRRSIRIRQAGIGQEASSANRSSSKEHESQFRDVVPEILSSLPPRSERISITAHLRNLHTLQLFKGTKVEHKGVVQQELGYRLERPSTSRSQLSLAGQSAALGNARTLAAEGSLLPSVEMLRGAPLGSSVVAQAGNATQDAIDTLIVTTKADATIRAMEQLVERLTPASTVVLLQNGMGVADEIIDTYFPDPADRPHIILGNVTHGCATKLRHYTQHNGFGSIHLGLLPDALGRFNYEVPGLAPTDAQRQQQPTLNWRALQGGMTMRSLPGSWTHRSLHYTLASFLALPLDVRWEPFARYQTSALRKLAVNACINPLSAIIDCRNGQLIDNDYAQETWARVCQEAGEIFLALMRGAASNRPQEMSPMYHRSGKATAAGEGEAATHPAAQDPWAHLIHQPLGRDAFGRPREPVLDASLTPSALLSAARKIANQTSGNLSSMHADVRGSKASPHPRGMTEIDYINGYLVMLGRRVGVKTPTNEMLVSSIKKLAQQSRPLDRSSFS